jgi:hypothetical protein
MSSVAAASDQLGIPERTISHWRDDPRLAELAAKTRDEVADGFRVLTGLAIDRLAQLIPTMEARDLTILAGVAVDKGQLLAGGATSRTEHKELLQDFDDHEKDAVRDWLRGVVRERLNVDA